MTIRALEFYSGIGGLHRALKISDINAQVVRAFDWDQQACRVYDANYGGGIVQKTNISTIDALTLLDLEAPFWLLSPSCQPYTVLNPVAKGSSDPRAKSFLHLIEHVLPDLARQNAAPKWILIENVAGFENSTTRQILLDQMSKLNYNTLELLLTPLQFGIPNSRLRYYLLAKARPLTFASLTHYPPTTVLRHVPGDGEPWVDDREAVIDLSVRQIREYLDPVADTDEAFGDHPSRIPDRVLEKWGRLFDIVLPSGRRSCCFTRGYTQMVERAGSILQVNENLDTTYTFDKFLASQSCFVPESSDDPQAESDRVRPVHTLRPLKLRYFTTSELLRLFHFAPPFAAPNCQQTGDPHRTFVWPSDISEKSKYRLLGNSVNVEVVRRLVNYLFEGDFR